MTEPQRIHIPPKTGAAFTVDRGQTFRVIDLEAGQVTDLICFNRDDLAEGLSSGHTTDYTGKLFLSAGDVLYSNCSRPMLTITADRVGRHIMLYAPCSQAMFEKTYQVTGLHPNCLDNLADPLAQFGIRRDQIGIPLNLFMNVAISTEGKITIQPPVSKAGDYVELRAEIDLAVAVSACPAGLCNDFTWSPIDIVINSGVNPE